MDYRTYARDYVITSPEKPPIQGSSDPAFRGDPQRYNPEEMFVASLAACHMLWYLHLCADAKVVVLDYSDEAEGTMVEAVDGSGHFEEVILKPTVVVARKEMMETAKALHERAHQLCFIASSCNFPVRHEPVTRVTGI